MTEEPIVKIPIPSWVVIGKSGVESEQLSITRAQELIKAFELKLWEAEEEFAKVIEKDLCDNHLHCAQCGKQIIVKTFQRDSHPSSPHMAQIMCPEVETNRDNWYLEGHVGETVISLGGRFGVYQKLAELREKGDIY